MNIICIFYANCQKTCMGKILALIMWLAFYIEEENTFCSRLLFALFVSVNNFNTAEPGNLVHLVIISRKVSSSVEGLRVY